MRVRDKMMWTVSPDGATDHLPVVLPPLQGSHPHNPTDVCPDQSRARRPKQHEKSLTRLPEHRRRRVREITQGKKEMKRLSSVMKAKREDINVDHSVCNGVNKSVFLVDATAPLALQRSFERFGFPDTRKRMLHDIGKQGTDATHDLLVAGALPIAGEARICSVASCSSFFPTMRFSALTALRMSSSSAEIIAN